MDLKQYFRKLRDVETNLVDAYPVVISLETEDGGKEGVVSEVSRETAAKLIVEGRAILASEEQKQSFLHHLETVKRNADKLELARRVQVAIIADPDLQSSVISKRTALPGHGSKIMALFTDPDVVVLDDLLQFESGLVQVSSTHGIDISSKIKLASDEIGDKILLFLLRAGHSQIGSSGSRIDYQGFNTGRVGLDAVVVTPGLYKWICYESLARTYAEAYNVQLNTRFQSQWNEYEKQAASATETAFALGIGITQGPLFRPSLPKLVTGIGAMTAQSLFVQTAWVNALGEESALSPVNGLVLNGFSQVQVSMAEQGGAAPSTATGWNVYVSETQQNLSRQNTLIIPIGASWQMPETGMIVGSSPIGGQLPSRFVSSNRRWQRG